MRPLLSVGALAGSGRLNRPYPSPFPSGEGRRAGRFALTLALSPVRERVLGGSCDPRPIYSWFLPLSREMSLPCKAVTPVLASRMPTSIARRHWGCSPSSNFPGRLTVLCGTACVSRLDLPPAKASGCAGYGPPGRPRVRTWNGGDAFGTAPPGGTPKTQTDLLVPRLVPSQHQRRYECPEDLAELNLRSFGLRPFEPFTRIARLFSLCQGAVWGDLRRFVRSTRGSANLESRPIHVLHLI